MRGSSQVSQSTPRSTRQRPRSSLTTHTELGKINDTTYKMDQETEMRPKSGPISTLPVELLRMILEVLPDVPSLHAAVSCSLFYHAFLDAEKTVTTQVLMNQIDFNEVLPEAIMSSESALLHPHDPDSRDAILDFVARNLQQRAILPRRWSLQRALRLSRLHFYVDALTKKFVDDALTRTPLNKSSHPVTHQEICRIQRALYRFETYCNLFRPSEQSRCVESYPSPIYTEQQTLFFARFHPCENEQLGCIHDFLARAIAPAFNEVAEHDVSWGVAGVPYIDYTLSSYYGQYFLSLGVKKLYEISIAEGYEEQYRALNAKTLPTCTNDFLFTGFEFYVNDSLDDVYLDELTPEDERSRIGRPFFDDPDPGPVDAWRWAHLEFSRLHWVYQEDCGELREWGYVMWDRRRLETAGIFRQAWEDTPRTRDPLLEAQEAMREEAYLQNSWDQRQAVSSSGGSGWWSWGDESRVKWKKSRRRSWDEIARKAKVDRSIYRRNA